MSKTQKISFDYLYRYTWQQISKMYNDVAIKKNSTMTIGFVLINIDKENGTPSTSLGPKMGIEPNSLSRTLKNMEAIGLIYREKNPLDGRGVLIKLTDFGLQQREISKQIVIEFNKEISNRLSPHQIEVFLEVTQIIQEIINQKQSK